MTEEERAALAALRFNWAPVPDDVWRPSRFHVDGLHADVTRDVLNGLADAETSNDSSPIGLVLQGERGPAKPTCSAGYVSRCRNGTDISSW